MELFKKKNCLAFYYWIQGVNCSVVGEDSVRGSKWQIPTELKQFAAWPIKFLHWMSFRTTVRKNLHTKLGQNDPSPDPDSPVSPSSWGLLQSTKMMRNTQKSSSQEPTKTPSLWFRNPKAPFLDPKRRGAPHSSQSVPIFALALTWSMLLWAWGLMFPPYSRRQ